MIICFLAFNSVSAPVPSFLHLSHVKAFGGIKYTLFRIHLVKSAKCNRYTRCVTDSNIESVQRYSEKSYTFIN